MRFMKFLIVIYMLLFSFFSFAGLIDMCQRFLQKEQTPFHIWTIHDHNPQNQQSAIHANLMIFIDNGHVFAMNTITGSYFHIKGLSKVKAIVLHGSDLAVSANTEIQRSEIRDIGEIFRQFNLAALTEDGTVYHLKDVDKSKWVKFETDVNNISVSTLADGRTALSTAKTLY